ncbi:MAG: AcrB/AcrD/AcrF family protein [Chitinivibrionales bacterium]|nr:AcrB/AcrD/AcrF family protein [Chitinivibrionales bacterium]
MNFGKFSVDNPVLINILMITVIILGIFSLTRIPREQFREVPFFWAFISVPYPGVSAEDIEKTITVKIEEEMDGLPDLKEIASVSQEGLSIVRIQFDDGISTERFSQLFQEVQTRFNKVDLPDDILTPLIDDFSSADFLPVIEVILSGEVDSMVLNSTAKTLKDRLAALPQTGEIDMAGARDREIHIDVNQQKIEALGISLNEIVRAVQARNITVPGGHFETRSREYLLRTIGEIKKSAEFGEVIIRQTSAGREGTVRIDDIASVYEMLDPDAPGARFNGNNAISLKIAKVPDGSSVFVVDQVKNEVDKFRKTISDNISFTYFNDTSLRIRDSISALVANAIIGFFLLVGILFIFIGIRNSLITALGIPLTFAITFFIMEILGESLNGNSLFALVLVLGMIVDHAIVIVENSYRLRQRGFPRREAAIEGTNQVVVPVIAATLTTVAAFLPLMILPGILGKFLRVIPLIASIALAASTVEAIIFLPVHFADWSGTPKETKAGHWLRLERWYEKLIGSVFKHKVKIILSATAAILVIFSLVASVQQNLFQSEEYSYFYIDIELPTGAPYAKTNEIVRRFEKTILPRAGKGEVVSVSSTTGQSRQGNQIITSSNAAQIIVDITGKDEGRQRSLVEIMNEIKKECSAIPGAESVRYRIVRGGPPVDPPISFRLFGNNYSEMITIAEDMKKKLRQYPELYNIGDNLQKGTPELRVIVNKDRAARFGLSVSAIGSHIRAGFDGIGATTVFDNNEEVDVIVSFGQHGPSPIDRLTGMKFPSSSGQLIPFSSVCSIEEAAGIAAIKRVDYKREVTVTAEAYDTKNIRSINKRFTGMFNEVYKPVYPGIVFKAGGEFAEFNNILVQILRLFLVGIFLIYVILGTQFKSYTQPLLILLTIPYSFAGVILYLILSRTPFSTTVLYAGVALAGIAVNDSIVLISFINNLRKQGKNVADAVREAARTRLRPILLTSVTTIGGLLPTALGLGGESPIWQPMASTIIFGLLFSTITALIIIPCFYGILVRKK